MEKIRFLEFSLQNVNLSSIFLYYFFSIPLELSILPSKSGTGNFSRLPRSSVDFPNESLGKNWQTPRGLSVFHEEGTSVVRRVHRVKFSSPNLPLRYGEKRKDEYIEERVLSILHRYLGISSFLPRKKLLFKKKKRSTIPPCNFHVELTRDRFAISPYDFSNARR